MTSTDTKLDLPFIQVKNGVVNYWAPDRAAGYEAQCAAGRAYADTMLAYIRGCDDVLIFGHIVRAIVQGGVYGGVEIGFCSRLNIVLAIF